MELACNDYIDFPFGSCYMAIFFISDSWAQGKMQNVSEAGSILFV